MVPIALAAGALIGYGLNAVISSSTNEDDDYIDRPHGGWYTPPHRRNSFGDVKLQQTLIKGFKAISKGKKPSNKFLEIISWEVENDNEEMFPDTDAGDALYEACVATLEQHQAGVETQRGILKLLSNRRKKAEKAAKKKAKAKAKAKRKKAKAAAKAAAKASAILTSTGTRRSRRTPVTPAKSGTTTTTATKTP